MRKNNKRNHNLLEALGFEKPALRKLGLNELKRIIQEEKEAADAKKDSADAGSSVPEKFNSPKMTSTPEDGKGNITEVPADEIVAQMLSGDPSAPVIVAMGAFHNTAFTPDFSNNVATKEGALELQKWVMSRGPAFISNNIKTVQDSIPSSGLPKSKMPALEPDDVGAVKDALEPGGDFNIDLSEPLADDEENVEAWFEKQREKESEESADTKAEALNRIAARLVEEKFPQNHPDGMPGGSKSDPKDLALAFLTKGLKDGAESDDSIQVKENEPINVADMIPTQSNIQLGKSLTFALGGGFGGKELGAYVTGGNEILDGHHRWSGTMIVDPGASIKGHKVFAPADDILPALTALGNAFGNQQKGRETKKESVNNNDKVILERWQKLAGILK